MSNKWRSGHIYLQHKEKIFHHLSGCRSNTQLLYSLIAKQKVWLLNICMFVWFLYFFHPHFSLFWPNLRQQLPLTIPNLYVSDIHLNCILSNLEISKLISCAVQSTISSKHWCLAWHCKAGLDQKCFKQPKMRKFCYYEKNN